MEEKDRILLSAIRVLDDKKMDILITLRSYKEEMDQYLKEKEELDNITEEDIDKIVTPEVEALYEKLSKFGKCYATADKLIKDLYAIKDEITRVINYENNGKTQYFIELVDLVDIIKIDNVKNTMNQTSKLTGIKYNLKEKNLSDINEMIKKAKAIQSFYLNLENTDYDTDRNKVTNDIKNVFKSINLKVFSDYEKVIQEMLVRIDKKMDEILDSIVDVKAKELLKRKEHIFKRAEEIKKKCFEEQAKFESINSILERYDKFLDNENPDDLLYIANSLKKLGVIKDRDLKKLRYVKQEKSIETTIENIKEEEKKEENSPKEFTLDYYRDSDTQNIICFLGKDLDDFFTDLDNYFDNSSRPIIIKKLNDLFINLYSNKDFIIQTGGNPHEGTNERVKEILSRPYDFDYRRYGTGKDPYRIHAITRHSDLLERLNYGKGNIIFFGSVGPNDTTEKSFTYARLGKRTIGAISENGLPAKLRSNFDSIEHITRGYVPLSLLSVEDKAKFENGEFSNKLKGSIDKICESKFVLFDVLDNNSKNNVKTFLDDYFQKQSIKMFNIINEYNDYRSHQFD